MSQGSVLKFKTSSVPRQDGEFARLRVLKGPDFGSTFVIRSSSVTMGRGEDSMLRLADPRASRAHAKIEFTTKGWKISDLGSANGIFFQGEYLRDFSIKSGNHFTIGDTIFEFLLNTEHTKILSAPIVEDLDLEKREVAFAQQKVRVQGLSRPVRFKPKKANPATLIALGLIGIGYFFPDEVRPLLKDYGLEMLAEYLPEGTQAQRPNKKDSGKKTEEEKQRSLASYLPPEVSEEVAKTSEQYYKQGFREYKAGNYLRAKESFELALQVNPGHERSRYYLASAIKENEFEIKRLIAAGKRAKDIGRLREAQGYFETAMRHMRADPENPDYVDCETTLKTLKPQPNGGTM